MQVVPPGAQVQPVPDIETVNQATAIARLNAGDVLEMAAGQTSGGDLSTTSAFGGRSASLAVQWFGP